MYCEASNSLLSVYVLGITSERMIDTMNLN